MHIQISIPKIWGRAAYPEGAHYDGRTLFPAGFDPDVSIRMQKPGSRRKSSGMRITRFTIVALGALAIVLFRFMSPHTSAELHNSKPTKTLNADSEIEVGSDVNKPKHALTPNVQRTTHSAPAAPRAGVTSTLVAMESYTQFITHKLWGKLTGALGMNHPDQVASCPVLMRVINPANPDHSWTVDVSINGLKVLSNVPFGSASRYVIVSPGNLRVRITKAGTRKLVDSRTFAGAPPLQILP